MLYSVSRCPGCFHLTLVRLGELYKDPPRVCQVARARWLVCPPATRVFGRGWNTNLKEKLKKFVYSGHGMVYMRWKRWIVKRRHYRWPISKISLWRCCIADQSSWMKWTRRRPCKRRNWRSFEHGIRGTGWSRGSRGSRRCVIQNDAKTNSRPGRQR